MVDDDAPDGSEPPGASGGPRQRESSRTDTDDLEEDGITERAPEEATSVASTAEWVAAALDEVGDLDPGPTTEPLPNLPETDEALITTRARPPASLPGSPNAAATVQGDDTAEAANHGLSSEAMAEIIAKSRRALAAIQAEDDRAEAVPTRGLTPPPTTSSGAVPRQEVHDEASDQTFREPLDGLATKLDGAAVDSADALEIFGDRSRTVDDGQAYQGEGATGLRRSSVPSFDMQGIGEGVPALALGGPPSANLDKRQRAADDRRAEDGTDKGRLAETPKPDPLDETNLELDETQDGGFGDMASELDETRLGAMLSTGEARAALGGAVPAFQGADEPPPVRPVSLTGPNEPPRAPAAEQPRPSPQPPRVQRQANVPTAAVPAATGARSSAPPVYSAAAGPALVPSAPVHIPPLMLPPAPSARPASVTVALILTVLAILILLGTFAFTRAMRAPVTSAPMQTPASAVEPP